MIDGERPRAPSPRPWVSACTAPWADRPAWPQAGGAARRPILGGNLAPELPASDRASIAPEPTRATQRGASCASRANRHGAGACGPAGGSRGRTPPGRRSSGDLGRVSSGVKMLHPTTGSSPTFPIRPPWKLPMLHLLHCNGCTATARCWGTFRAQMFRTRPLGVMFRRMWRVDVPNSLDGGVMFRSRRCSPLVRRSTDGTQGRQDISRRGLDRPPRSSPATRTAWRRRSR